MNKLDARLGRSHKARLALTLYGFGAHAPVSPRISHPMGTAALTLATIQVIAAGWLLKVRAGLFAGWLAMPQQTLLVNVVEDQVGTYSCREEVG